MKGKAGVGQRSSWCLVWLRGLHGKKGFNKGQGSSEEAEGVSASWRMVLPGESRKQFRQNEMKSGCCPSRRDGHRIEDLMERVEQNARK